MLCPCSCSRGVRPGALRGVKLFSDLPNRLCCRRAGIAATWLWASATSCYKRYDPTADIYSLSFCFLEVRPAAGVDMPRRRLLVCRELVLVSACAPRVLA